LDINLGKYFVRVDQIIEILYTQELPADQSLDL